MARSLAQGQKELCKRVGQSEPVLSAPRQRQASQRGWWGTETEPQDEERPWFRQQSSEKGAQSQACTVAILTTTRPDLAWPGVPVYWAPPGWAGRTDSTVRASAGADGARSGLTPQPTREWRIVCSLEWGWGAHNLLPLGSR